MDKEAKTLEEIIRDKFSTGYDPIKLSVKAKSLNEENIDVLIEGHHYSIRDNQVTLVEKKSSAPANPTPPADPEHPINGGSVTNPAPEPEQGNGSAGLAETQNPAPATPLAGADGDADGNGVDDTLEARQQEILTAYGAAELKPVATAGNGATIFGVIASDGAELSRGTILELLTLVRSPAGEEQAAS